ncbi:MAG TPA: hypothetical protein VM347_41965 [Nonomuraea sp.]|nr:hypothetical protein [Nonomuraea sp.]
MAIRRSATKRHGLPSVVQLRLTPTPAPMFSVILIAGRWAAEKHPESIAPDTWTRDMAAEYVADTLQATVGQWAGHNRNQVRYGQPISASGMANRIDSLRSFFCDLIE